MTQQELQAHQQKMHNELAQEYGRATMKWDEMLRQWHSLAMVALKHNGDPASLGWPANRCADLCETTEEGVNLQVVGALTVAFERTTQAHFGMSSYDEYAGAQKLNTQIIKRWTKETEPIRLAVAKRMQIMNTPASRGIIGMKGGQA